MKKLLITLLLLSLIPFVNAEQQSTDTANWWELCSYQWVDDNICSTVTKVYDTINPFSGDELDEAKNNANSVQALEVALIEEDISFSKERVVDSWLLINSLLILLLEVVKIVYYLFQIFVIVHLPYIYVSLLVWVKKRFEAMLL